MSPPIEYVNPDKGTQDCAKCGGTGKLEEGGISLTCVECQRAFAGRCDFCNGNGYILEEFEIDDKTDKSTQRNRIEKRFLCESCKG